MLRAALVAIAAMRARASNYTFVWFHPHKCGTSFALTLMRYDCRNLPDDAALDTTASTAATQPRPSKLIGDFKAKYDCDARLNGEHTRVGRERRSRDGSEQLEWSSASCIGDDFREILGGKTMENRYVVGGAGSSAKACSSPSCATRGNASCPTSRS